VFDARVATGLDAQRFAATAVPHDVAFFVPFRPLPIGSGDLLAWREHSRLMLVASYVTLALHRAMNDVVEILSRLVVRRHDERGTRIFDVLGRDRAHALLAWTDFVHATLLIEAFDPTADIST
jgi:hypothetical protein